MKHEKFEWHSRENIDVDEYNNYYLTVIYYFYHYYKEVEHIEINKNLQKYPSTWLNKKNQYL